MKLRSWIKVKMRKWRAANFSRKEYGVSPFSKRTMAWVVDVGQSVDELPRSIRMIYRGRLSALAFIVLKWLSRQTPSTSSAMCASIFFAALLFT
jgi:hypothetical protein